MLKCLKKVIQMMKYINGENQSIKEILKNLKLSQITYLELIILLIYSNSNSNVTNFLFRNVRIKNFTSKIKK